MAKKDEYLKAKPVVAGRFVNGYATKDWILGYLFRATGGGIMRVAGLAPVECPGIENINVSETVPGHMQYRAAMPKLLRQAGWSVESDEFTEIEDPDPDNHENRQRELINEIEEARKELEKKPEKRRFKDFFKTKGKSDKKAWETYDERTAAALGNKDNVPKEGEGGVLFDVEAIRAEVAELAAEGLQVRELESTLPPMKLDLPASSPRAGSPAPALKSAKSFNEAVESSSKDADKADTLSRHQTNPEGPSYDSWDDYEKSTGGLRSDGSIQMTFDTSYAERPVQKSFDLPRPPPKEQWPPNPAEPSWSSTPNTQRPSIDPSHRPSLEQSKTASAHPANPTQNAWADEDDEFGGEKEMKMTFE